jgi:hypothetical protein
VLLRRKARVFADADVPEYRVADVSVIHQMWSPEGDYSQRREIALGERIAAMTVPGLEIASTI